MSSGIGRACVEIFDVLRIILKKNTNTLHGCKTLNQLKPEKANTFIYFHNKFINNSLSLFSNVLLIHYTTISI